MPLSQAVIEAQLTTRVVGRALEYYAQIDSTNTRAVQWAANGAPDGAVVVADHQTAGRGRLGRRWQAPPLGALLFSVILRPQIDLVQAQRTTMICSLSAVDAIRSVTGLAAQVKWPNDILIDGKKLGGLLTELGAQGQFLRYAVVGVGLNVNLDPADLGETATPATSLSSKLGTEVSRAVLLAGILAGIETRYLAMQAGWSPHTEWRGVLATLGKKVRVSTPEQVIEGVAEDVDADGALLLRTPAGVLDRVLVGDVTLRENAR